MGAPVLYLAPAALLGLAWAHVQLLGGLLSHPWRQALRRRHVARASFVGLLLGACVWPVAEATFSGSWIQGTWLGTWGPVLFALGFGASTAICTYWVWRAQRLAMKKRLTLPLGYACSLFALGISALIIDMRFYVDLYPELHALLEYSAMALFFCAYQLAGFILLRFEPRLLPYNRLLALCLLTLGGSFLGSRSLRTWTDSHLAHAWVDEFYVGRALRRAQELELQLTGGSTLELARVDHLARRFGLKTRELDEKWLKPTRLSGDYPEVKNIVFFYVDTLRADAARDPQLMPHLARFRERSLDLKRAYASGSDTLRSLPTITGGNYLINKTHSGDLLELARSRNVHSRIVLAQSAQEFLAKLLPTFEFDSTVAISDYGEDEKVWGYGAHRPTAERVTDAGIDFLESNAADSPFFLWLFQFDQHAWRELDDEYIAHKRKEFGIERHGRLNLRYRVIARSLDEQFARLLEALRKSGHERDTAVVFISDHGEGLGQGGFWVHSIFLWESLIHVPLVIHIPGWAPGSSETPVSLVDLAPTLAPIWSKLPVGKGARHPLETQRALYHGQPLSPQMNASERHYPILLRGGRFSGLDRVGIVDAESRRKLVIRLEAAFPELHDYEEDHLDRRNLARSEEPRVRQLLSELATSPVFPRDQEDFEEQSPRRDWLTLEEVKQAPVAQTP